VVSFSISSVVFLECSLACLWSRILFTEARYQYADTGQIPTRMVPVTFGIRW
jgi:hypothetical protein